MSDDPPPPLPPDTDPRPYADAGSIPETRRSLFLQLERRSDAAWQEFLSIYEGAIYRVCRSRGLQDADALDVTQDVLRAVHERIPTWEYGRSHGSFRSWLLRVARNISIDKLRERARRPVVGSGTEVDALISATVDPGSESETLFDLEYARGCFQRAMTRVRSEVREVTWRAFEMTAVDELPPDEVASALGIAIGSVYTAKCRVVARIRKYVEVFEIKKNERS
ncbi:MAG: RNA polymerase sigma factor [Planctomycetes bacterium]|nr:RNA polymerase sigma factor [Planctomycetota bacterium]